MVQPLPYRYVYLSPHLDDAVLSCGGLIHRQRQEGESVLVVTIFAGSADQAAASDFATSLCRSWGLGPDPVMARRIEDQRALSFLSAEYRHLQ